MVYLLFFWCVSCAKEEAVPVQVDFYVKVENQDYSVPVLIKIINQTQDADTYHWTFEGGSPSISTDKNPGIIQYSNAGDYTIRLQASNKDGSEGSKEIKVTTDADIIAGFKAIVVDDHFPPVMVNILNTTEGAKSFQWTFEGGEPSLSFDREPGVVVFEEPGDYRVRMEASNGRESKIVEQTVSVASHLLADFDFEPVFEDDDLQVPVTLMLKNNSISATEYEWTFEGGNPTTNNGEDPQVVFNNHGTYSIQLKANNGKASQTISKQVTLFPNTNLRIFSNVRLGINTAHNTNSNGAFFSTKTRMVYSKDDLPNLDGSLVDIAFFGLNADFTFNKFISPDEVQEYTFDAIPNANHTKFINLQESCNCSAALTMDQFDAMEDDTLLQSLNIEETLEGTQDFDDAMVPRIILFKTSDGRKGAIKIKEFIQAGLDSYILVDIKVQKQ
ncbi:PKD domain-containing protein [Flagellimonas aequoris]|nr:PKD domain-containing protein [Allomuricauda aequoris]